MLMLLSRLRPTPGASYRTPLQTHHWTLRHAPHFPVPHLERSTPAASGRWRPRCTVDMLLPLRDELQRTDGIRGSVVPINPLVAAPSLMLLASWAGRGLQEQVYVATLHVPLGWALRMLPCPTFDGNRRRLRTTYAQSSPRTVEQSSCSVGILGHTLDSLIVPRSAHGLTRGPSFRGTSPLSAWRSLSPTRWIQQAVRISQ